MTNTTILHHRQDRNKMQVYKEKERVTSLFLYFVGELLHNLKIGKELLGKHSYYRIGGYGYKHSYNSTYMACYKDDKKNLKRVGFYAV